MTDLHPLTQKLADDLFSKVGLQGWEIPEPYELADSIVRDHLTPTLRAEVESGVLFPNAVPGETPSVAVEATFMTVRDGQLQMALIGPEPVLLVQPNYEAETNEVTFITTAVELNPQGLIDVLHTLLDAAEAMVSTSETQA